MNNRRFARRRRVRDCGFCHDDVDKISAVEYQKLFSLKGLNQFIEYLHFKMESFSTVVSLVKRNCYMASVDLKDALLCVLTTITMLFNGNLKTKMNNRRFARRRRVRDCGFGHDDVDKISAVEYQKMFPLIEVIYTHVVFTEIERFCEENCCGCKIDHPSQRQHDCLMLTEEEKWELY